MNYEKERLEIIETALKLKDNNLIKMSGGNVSYKIGDNTILVTPTAMEYETMKPEDIVVVNKDGDIIDGIRKPTSDLKAILYIFLYGKVIILNLDIIVIKVEINRI